jgi:hypothetical protein
MRMLMKVSLPAERANAAIQAGSFANTIQAILEEQRPEAVYFTEMNGQRTGLIFVNLEETSDVIRFAEPWWQAFGGSVEWHPAMVPADLGTGGAALEAAAQKYGRQG